MRPVAHAVVGVELGAAVWLATGEPGLGLLACLVEIFWDVDHVVEYVFHQWGQLSVVRFFQRGQAATWPRVVFFLHGHEWVAVLAMMAWAMSSEVVGVMALGGGVHMAMDEWGNRRAHIHHRIHGLFYFFLFRLSRGFRKEALAQRKGAGPTA